MPKLPPDLQRLADGQLSPYGEIVSLRKELQHLWNLLGRDEHIQRLVRVIPRGIQRALLAVTTERVLLIRKRYVPGFSVRSIPYDELEAVSDFRRPARRNLPAITDVRLQQRGAKPLHFEIFSSQEQDHDAVLKAINAMRGHHARARLERSS